MLNLLVFGLSRAKPNTSRLRSVAMKEPAGDVDKFLRSNDFREMAPGVTRSKSVFLSSPCP